MGKSLKERTAHGIFWGGFNTFTQQLVQLGFGIIMARILTPGDYGLIGMITVFTMIANTLQESGFSSTLIKMPAPTKEDYSSVFWFNVLISIVIYLILFVSAPFIADFFEEPILTSYSRVVFLAFVFNALGIIQNAILTKRIAQKELAMVNLGSILLSCILGLIFALLNYAHWAIAIQAVSLSFFRTILLWKMSSWRPVSSLCLPALKKMFPFSVKLLFSGIITQLAGGAYSFVLGKYYDADQVGYYTQANKWYTIPYSIVYGIINTLALPVLSEVSDEKDRQRAVFRKMMRFTAFISFPMILGLAFIANEFILVLVTDKWLGAVAILQILCIWGAFTPIYSLYANVMISRGHPGVNLAFSLVNGCLLIATIIATVHLGVVKLLLFTTGINLLTLVAYQIVSWKLLRFGLTDFYRDVIPFVAITMAVFFVVSLLLKPVDNIYILLVLKIVLSAILYVVVMKLLRVVIMEEILVYFNGLKHKLMNKINNGTK
nr:lipopolysaccharide biosynthesis protein [uncultured Macellibacteroides sp.]